MARTILNTDSTGVGITAHKPAIKSDFVLIDTVIKPDGGREAVYQKVTGDELHPMTVRVGVYPEKNGNGANNTSVRVTTYVKDDGGEEDIFKVCSLTIATQMPWGPVPDVAGLSLLIQNAVSWLLPVDTDAYTTDALDELKFGVVNGLNGHVDN